MFVPQRVKRKILQWLSIACFVITLMAYFSLLAFNIPFSSSVAVVFKADAQTVELEYAQQGAQSAVAQAPVLLNEPVFQAPGLLDKSSYEPAIEEQSLGFSDFFEMAMGALAGLVLFLFGVTLLTEGLEALSTEPMRDLLSKFTTNRFAGVLTDGVAMPKSC
jgi:phosphate:Na+ symporter